MSAAKRAAGVAAAELVDPGMRLGLGTGSTVAYFLEALAARGIDVAGVPTSEATSAACQRLGISLLDLGEVEELDLVVDGADELTADLALTKGGGGALLREKVVAALASRFVVIATDDKLVDKLGRSFALPVEVVAFAQPQVHRRLALLGATTVRERDGGSYRTDNGNPILDATFDEGIEDVDVLDIALSMTPGVAEHGLFVGMADAAILGRPDGSVNEITPAST